MGKENNVYVQILNMFISDDPYREWMQKPFNDAGKTIATNSERLVAIPQIEEYNQLNKIGSIYPVNHNLKSLIKVNELQAKLKEFPTVDCYDTIIAECKECNGTGEVEWGYGSYTKDFDCPVCDGTGESEQLSETPNGGKEFDQTKYFQIGKCLFQVKYIQELFEVAKILESDEIYVVYQINNHSVTVFSIKDVEILIMPRLLDDQTNIAAILEIKN